MDTDTPNQKTIAAYEAHAQEYIDGVPQEIVGAVKQTLDKAFRAFSTSARVLEIGSGHGRDAAYVQQLGYAIECTDAAQSFVDILTQKNLPARRLNVVTDPINGSYDVILAIGVLLHFTRDETKVVLQKVAKALTRHGAFVCTLQQGVGETWKTNKVNAPRYFCYWESDKIESLLKNTGFADVYMESNGTKWLQIIARKK